MRFASALYQSFHHLCFRYPKVNFIGYYYRDSCLRSVNINLEFLDWLIFKESRYLIAFDIFFGGFAPCRVSSEVDRGSLSFYLHRPRFVLHLTQVAWINPCHDPRSLVPLLILHPHHQIRIRNRTAIPHKSKYTDFLSSYIKVYCYRLSYFRNHQLADWITCISCYWTLALIWFFGVLAEAWRLLTLAMPDIVTMRLCEVRFPSGKSSIGSELLLNM